MSISHFQYSYAYLSSHYPISVVLDEYPGRVFPSADNAYWALIYPDMLNRLSYSENADSRERLNTMNANEANCAGIHRSIETFKSNRALALTEKTKLRAMERVTQAKFDQHPTFKEKLMNTRGHRLFNHNTWGDRFWGLSVDSNGTWIGDNHLGKILMKLRAKYLKETGR